MSQQLERIIEALPGPGEQPVSLAGWSRRVHGEDPFPDRFKTAFRTAYYSLRVRGLLDGLVDVTEITTKGGPRYFFSRKEQPVTSEAHTYNPTLAVSSLARIALLKPRPARAFPVYVGLTFRGIR